MPWLFPDAWLRYDFPVAKIVTTYEVMTQLKECPAAWHLQGSNDGEYWFTIHKVTGQGCHANTFQSYAVTSPGSYIYYRWQFSQATPTPGTGSTDGYRILEIKMQGFQGGIYEMAPSVLHSLCPSLPSEPPSRTSVASAITDTFETDFGSWTNYKFL